MLANDGAFLVIEDEGANSRKKHRVGIQLLYTETGCRIAPMGASQARVKDSSECILVSRDPGKDCREVTSY